MYGYGYRYSIRPGYVPFNPLTDIDGLQLYLNKNTNVNSKLALSFDGSTDAVNIDSVLTPLANTTTGEIELYYTPIDATPLSNEYILSFGDTDANTFIAIQSRTDGKCKVNCVSASTTYASIETDSAVFSNGVQAKINVIQDGVNITIKIDGVEVAQTETGSTPSYWFNDIPLLDNGRIASLMQNSVGGQGWANGTIDDVKIWSDDTRTTLVASYLFNDANDPYKDYTNSYNGSAIGTPTSVVGSQQEPTEPLDEVFSWVDQSTNGFIFSQNTVTKQPQLASDGNSIDFDGIDDSLDNSTANVFSGDSSGIVFFSGYFDNTATNYLFTSSDNATSDLFLAFGVLTTGALFVQARTGGVTDTIKSTATISNGAYYYGYVKSNGTAYEFNVNGSISSPIAVQGTNRGHFFADISNRDNLVLGGLQYLTPIYSPDKVNKVIYSNDHTINTTPILNFLSNPDN